MKNISLKFLPILIASIVFYACTKSDGVTNQPYTAYGITATTGLLKINLASAYTANYATLVLKVNGKVVGTALQQRTPYPGGGYNTLGSNYAMYLNVPQGSDTVTMSLPKVGTVTDSIVLYSTIISISDNSAYTLHICDTLVNSSTNNTKSLLIKNPVNLIDTGFCRFRFVHMIPNLPAVDLYLNGVLIKSNISYLQPTDTFRVATGVNAPGYNSANTTTWAIRPAGAASTTTADASYASSNGLQSQKTMTIYTMGYNAGTSARLPYICFTLDNNQ